MRLLSVALPLLAAAVAPCCLICQETQPQPANTTPPPFTRKQSFGFTASYSNDSSPILFGVARDRKLFESGVTYSRSLWRWRGSNLQYDGEFLPLSFTGDPTERYTIVEGSEHQSGSFILTDETCHAGTTTGITDPQNPATTYSIVTTCSRQWNYSPSISPIGFQWNFRDKHRLQPIAMGHYGWTYSTLTDSNSGNAQWSHTFDFGAGVEWFQTARRSWRLEYRIRDLSNDKRYANNVGVDNGTFRLSYVFGK